MPTEQSYSIGRQRGDAASGERPVSGAEYCRALARERAVLGCVQTSLMLLVGAATVWVRPELVAPWARGFVACYLAGLAAVGLLLGLVLAVGSSTAALPGGPRVRAVATWLLLLALLPVVVVTALGR